MDQAPAGIQSPVLHRMHCTTLLLAPDNNSVPDSHSTTQLLVLRVHISMDEAAAVRVALVSCHWLHDASLLHPPYTSAFQPLHNRTRSGSSSCWKSLYHCWPCFQALCCK